MIVEMTAEFWFVWGMTSDDRSGDRSGIGMEIRCDTAGAPSSGEEGMNEESGRVGERFLGR